MITNIRIRLLLISTLPLAFFFASLVLLTEHQTSALSDRIARMIEERILEDKKESLRNYALIAHTAIAPYVQSPAELDPFEIEAKLVNQQRAKDILAAMTFGQDGYFYVYDFDGQNLVHPKQPHLVGQDLWNLQDPNDTYVIQGLIDRAKAGGGYHSYVWNKPSSQKDEPKIGYALGIEPWSWMLGTGLYLDDIRNEVGLATDTIDKAVYQSFLWVCALAFFAFTTAAIIIFGFQLNLQRLADQKLQALNHRIVQIQEEQSQRISRDLHDGVSQLLVASRYGIESVSGALNTEHSSQKSLLLKTSDTLNQALEEVRRVASSLRPPALDQLGLKQALETLFSDFSVQTGIVVRCELTPAGDKLTSMQKTAVYRIVQEALLNVSKHAQAKQIQVQMQFDSLQMQLSIEDDGIGIPSKHDSVGQGIDNMRERLRAIGGTLKIEPLQSGGTRLQGWLPLNQNQET